MARYKFQLKNKNGVITHVQESDEEDYQFDIPERWGFTNEGWLSEREIEEKGIDRQESIGQRQVQDEVTEEEITEYFFPKNYSVEVIDSESDPTLMMQKDLEYSRKLGLHFRNCCDEILDIIAGYNRRRNLSIEQVDNMEGVFGPIVQALSVQRVDKAHTLINQIVPDGIMVTQQMIDAVNMVFERYVSTTPNA